MIKQIKITKTLTDRGNKCLNRYFTDIAKIKMITPDDEIELTRRIKDGDEKAKQILIGANLKFVISVAKQFLNNGIELSDLINEGNIGLIIAAQRFDETKGFKFISYAVWWIRQAILEALSENIRQVRVPRNITNNLVKVRDAAESLGRELGRGPTDSELASFLDMKEEQIAELNEINSKSVFLDDTIDEHDANSHSYIEIIKDSKAEMPDEKLMLSSLKEDISRALRFLRPNEKKVIELYYGLNGNESMTLESIAEIMDFTTERIRQLCRSAVLKIKKSKLGELLKKYLQNN